MQPDAPAPDAPAPDPQAPKSVLQSIPRWVAPILLSASLLLNWPTGALIAATFTWAMLSVAVVAVVIFGISSTFNSGAETLRKIFLEDPAPQIFPPLRTTIIIWCSTVLFLATGYTITAFVSFVAPIILRLFIFQLRKRLG